MTALGPGRPRSEPFGGVRNCSGEKGNGKRVVVPAERRRLILEMLREQGSLTVGAVEEAFDVSPMTARRDLALLTEVGHARRTHGGAVLPELTAHEDSFQSRLGQEAEAKRRLAGAVVATIEPGETIFVDCSSSSYYVVREFWSMGFRSRCSRTACR